MGKKTLMCDFTGSKLYDNFNEMVYFKKKNYSDFEQTLNALRKETAVQYKSRTSTYQNYLMKNKKNIYPHISIRNKINEILSL